MNHSHPKFALRVPGCQQLVNSETPRLRHAWLSARESSAFSLHAAFAASADCFVENCLRRFAGGQITKDSRIIADNSQDAENDDVRPNLRGRFSNGLSHRYFSPLVGVKLVPLSPRITVVPYSGDACHSAGIKDAHRVPHHSPAVDRYPDPFIVSLSPTPQSSSR